MAILAVSNGVLTAQLDSTKFGSAIFSVTKGTYEFVNSHDVGRLIQTAVQVDAMGEDKNPTEGGAETDTTVSSSQVYSMTLVPGSNGRRAKTQSNMAYWRPWQGQVASDCTLYKDIGVGFYSVANCIRHDITIVMADAHSSARFEILTAYVPPSLSEFYAYGPRTGILTPLSDPPVPPTDEGLQLQPIIFHDPVANQSIGVCSPYSPMYGRWRFVNEQVNKWTALLTTGASQPNTIRKMRTFSVYGSLAQCQDAISTLVDIGEQPAFGS